MKCPICENELEIRTKKTGENENGDAIYNEFAVCHNCKKQWNLDKHRAKNNTNTPAKEKEETPAQQPRPKKKRKRPVQASEGAVKADKSPVEKTDEAQAAPRPKKKRPVQKPVSKAAGSDSAEEVKKETDIPASEERPRPKKKKRPVPKSENGETVVRPAFGDAPEEAEAPARPRPKKKKRPVSADGTPSAPTAEKPVQPRPKKVKPAPKAMDEPVEEFIDAFEERSNELPRPRKRKPIDNVKEESTYSNIPPKHVREAREQEMRDNYQAMLDEDDEWEDEGRRFPVWLIIIIVLILLAAAGFAGYWFILR